MFFVLSLVVLWAALRCTPVAAQQVRSFLITAPSDLAARSSSGFPPASFGIYAHSNNSQDPQTQADSIGFDAAVDVAVDQLLPEMPNLQEYFHDEYFTGTLELLFRNDMDGDTSTPEDVAPDRMPHDIVISEIMWGLDNAENQGKLHLKQWIELVNTTGKAVYLNSDDNGDTANVNETSGRWILHFTPDSHYTPKATVQGTELNFIGDLPTGIQGSPSVSDLQKGAYKVIDRVSTFYLSKWLMPGQNGRTAEGEQDRFQTQDVIPLISAYRHIDVTTALDATTKEWAQRGTGAEPHEFGKVNIPDGLLSEAWRASNTRRNMRRAFLGTPKSLYVGPTVGAAVIETPVPSDVPGKTRIPSDAVVINEIRNDTSLANLDWVELYNAGDTAVNLRNYELTYHNADPDPQSDGTGLKDTDIMLVGKEADSSDADRFPDFELQPGAYLLIVSRNPMESPLAGGINIDEWRAGQDLKNGSVHQYIVRPKIGTMPNSGNFMLILRDHLEKNWSHHATLNINNFHKASENIIDYAGNYFVSNYTPQPLTRIPHYNTRVWPFRGWDRPSNSETIPSNKYQAWARTRYNADDGHHEDTWDHVIGIASPRFPGANSHQRFGVGYDRQANLEISPGTPGYVNDSLKDRTVDNKGAAKFNGTISISEIMYDPGQGQNKPQWIELYNSSLTQAIHLKDWQLTISNVKSEDVVYVNSSFTFNEDAVVLPNQTLLLVSDTWRNDVPENRVYNLFKHHRQTLGLSNRRSLLLNPEGFYLKLTHHDSTQPNNPHAMLTLDEAGNLRVSSNGRRVLWQLPEGNFAERRQSVLRRYGKRWIDMDRAGEAPENGLLLTSWQLYARPNKATSFYGPYLDIGTPGYRRGAALPVSLSSFRPARDKATGEVVITWATESELNNAGFNILRSETKSGAFKVINVKGIIVGHGTTSEKHLYTFKDTTTKPNVVYYYQIEDVALDGKRTTLATTHLRGNVTAADKLTIMWGDLKISH